nr:MAG TPA: minor structural protein [Caudoviricetes sp.]
MSEIIKDPAGAGGAGAGSGAGGEGIMVPKYRLDEALQRAQAAEAKVAELNNVVSDLNKQIEGTKAKDDKIAELEKSLADEKAGREADKVASKKLSVVDAAIKNRVVDEEVVRKLIDMDKISFNDKGETVGLDEQIKALQEGKSYLWKPVKPVVKAGAQGAGPAEKSFAQKLAEQKKSQLQVTAKSKTYF